MNALLSTRLYGTPGLADHTPPIAAAYLRSSV